MRVACKLLHAHFSKSNGGFGGINGSREVGVLCYEGQTENRQMIRYQDYVHSGEVYKVQPRRVDTVSGVGSTKI